MFRNRHLEIKKKQFSKITLIGKKLSEQRPKFSVADHLSMFLKGHFASETVETSVKE